ncbi:MAG TPA: transporter substrate-binding domain-containing protein [Microbacterium sp.]|nr:transporter substrate-binding domain-containing protein [Microbacterium sp.]
MRTTLRPRAGMTIGLFAVAVGLVGCTSAAPEATPDADAEAAVAPPAINEEGILSVCSALGLGAIPLFYFDEAQEPQGIEIDMARDVATRLGLEYREVSTAFPSLVPSLDAKQCDLVMGSLFITDERSEAVDFVPYLESGSALIVRADDDEAVSEYGQELCGKRVGVTTGSSAAAAIKEFEAECDAADALVLTEVDSAATGRQMLLNAQLDVMAGSSADLYYIAAESDGAIKVAGEPFQTFEVGAAVRKGNTDLQDAVASAFEDMVADGTYDEILAGQGLEAISYFD